MAVTLSYLPVDLNSTNSTKSSGSYMLTTRWDQRPPFNDRAKVCMNNGVHGDRAPAGCQTVAIAQIMTYHKHSNFVKAYKYITLPIAGIWLYDQNIIVTYQWDYAKNYMYGDNFLNNAYNMRDFVASLFSMIFYETKISFSCAQSGSDESDANRCFKNCGYTTNGVSNYNINTIFDDLVIGRRPVFITGKTSKNEGHAWVMDGHAFVPGTFDSYYHCNWGFGRGDGNGYYYSKVFTVGRNYTSDEDLPAHTSSMDF